jgi:hypothetical protein
MSRMLELIRASALPSHQVMTASKGALHVPPAEMVEILVYLAEHNKIFAEQAKLTLAAWDEASAKVIAAEPHTPKEVLDYWLSPKNFRPALFPILIENPAVLMSKLSELAATLKGEWIDLMLASPRIRASRQTLTDMNMNPDLSGVQNARVQELLTGQPTARVSEPQQPEASPELTHTPATDVIEVPAPATSESAAISEAAATSPLEAAVPTPEVPVSGSPDSQDDDHDAHAALVAFLAEHAAEIAAKPDKPFQAIGGIYDELPIEAEPKTAAAAAASSPAVVAAQASQRVITATPAIPHPVPHHKKLVNPQDEQRGSVLQKIARLDVKGRIQLAMKGTKEERSILVRDGTKIVALAVLDSPKISDGEVEKFASQKNVLEAVLRTIPLKRRFAKNYAVVRNLVFNPRTPLDVALGLMKNLLVQDLRHLSGNKEVADTVRKLALRMFKQKSENASKK